MAKKNKTGRGRRRTRFLFIGFLTCFSGLQAKGKDPIPNEQHARNSFSWMEHRTLSWNDFKGNVDTQSNESAAATCCSIGFRVENNAAGHPEVSVYNNFYIDRSWVKDDARIESILAHEQGHFDLCELYTRKLRSSLNTIDLNSPDVKQELMKIYAAVSDEYEARQQAYEQETAHGTVIPEQKKWQNMISSELGQLPALM